MEGRHDYKDLISDELAAKWRAWVLDQLDQLPARVFDRVALRERAVLTLNYAFKYGESVDVIDKSLSHRYRARLRSVLNHVLIEDAVELMRDGRCAEIETRDSIDAAAVALVSHVLRNDVHPLMEHFPNPLPHSDPWPFSWKKDIESEGFSRDRELILKLIHLIRDELMNE